MKYFSLGKYSRPTRSRSLPLVAAGLLALVTERHSDVPIFTAALDRELNARKYILPGLGDFGDRLYGT